jgi:hypothetical protein
MFDYFVKILNTPKKIKNNRCDDDVEYFIPKDILTS